jgi:hypothetical protein
MAGSEAGKLHKDDLEGVHNALMESRLPVNLITEPQVARRDWQAARVIVLPSVECLDDDCLAALRSYVENGGGLVVTGRSSLATADGAPRGNFGLAELLGVDYSAMTPCYYTYFCPDESHPALGGLTTGFPLSVYETFQTLVRARSGTKPLGIIMAPLPGFHMGYPPHKRTGHPGMTVREVGQGRVVYFASAQGAIYSRFNHPDQKQLLASAITWAAGAPAPISADAPETLEVIPWRDETARKTTLCLLNRTGAGPAQGPSGALVHETIPLHGITVRIEKSLAGTKAMLAPAQVPLPIRWEGDHAVLTIERVDEMAIVVCS